MNWIYMNNGPNGMDLRDPTYPNLPIQCGVTIANLGNSHVRSYSYSCIAEDALLCESAIADKMHCSSVARGRAG